MLPNYSDGVVTEKCNISVGQQIRLKGTQLRMVVNAVYRTCKDTRVKAQWADTDGDGFVDIPLAMADPNVVESKPVKNLVFECLCPV